MARLIDADALIERLEVYPVYNGMADMDDIITFIREMPTIGGWISVKDRLPEEHDSMFAQFYGTSRWNGAMWRTESDRVLVAILFPDGTRTVDKGKLQDGEWRTGVARVLPQKVTHWAVWPEPPKEESDESDT